MTFKAKTVLSKPTRMVSSFDPAIDWPATAEALGDKIEPTEAQAEFIQKVLDAATSEAGIKAADEFVAKKKIERARAHYIESMDTGCLKFLDGEQGGWWSIECMSHKRRTAQSIHSSGECSKYADPQNLISAGHGCNAVFNAMVTWELDPDELPDMSQDSDNVVIELGGWAIRISMSSVSKRKKHNVKRRSRR